MVTAFIWAGFNGFGGIWYEYNRKGQIASYIILMEPIVVVCLLLFQMVKHHRRKREVRFYIYDILFGVLGTGIGIFLLYLIPEPRQTIIDFIIHYIRKSNWLDF